MTRTLLIGIGNELRGDDAAGIVAAMRISQRHPDIRCLLAQELAPELAEEIAEYDTVLFLDASIESPVVRIEELSSEQAAGADSHHHTPASILTLSQALYERLPRRMLLLHIPAESFDLGGKLSQRTATAVDSAVRLADSILADLMAYVTGGT